MMVLLSLVLFVATAPNVMAHHNEAHNIIHDDVHISTKHHAIDTEKIGVVGTFEFDVPVGSDVEIQGVYIQDDHKEQVFFPNFPLALPTESTQIHENGKAYDRTRLFYSVDTTVGTDHVLPVEIYYTLGDDNFVYHETDYITMDNVRGNPLDAFDYWVDQNIFDEFGQFELFGFVFYEKVILGAFLL